MRNKTNEFIELLDSFIEALSDLKEEAKKAKDEDKITCPCKEEKIKSFEECTLGEKFILYLLDKNKIHVNENMIEDAEAFIYNNPVLDFLIMHDKDILDNLNALLNSLYEVNLEKLRVKKS